MQRLLRTFLKTTQSLLAAKRFVGRRNPKRPRQLNSTDSLEERCVLALGDVLQTLVIHPSVSQNLSGDSDVALKGNRALVGATYLDLANNVEFRAAKLFDATTGNTLASFADPFPLLEGVFASRVELTDSHVLISKTHKSTGGGVQQESVFVYDFQGNYQRQIVSPNSELSHGTGFGSVLASHGNLVLIGAPNEQNQGNRKGAAYLFNASNGQFLHRFESQLPRSSNAFGRSVAMNEQTIVISDPAATVAPYRNGAVFEYETLTGDLKGTFLVADGESEEFGTIGRLVALNGNQTVSSIEYESFKLVRGLGNQPGFQNVRHLDSGDTTLQAMDSKSFSTVTSLVTAGLSENGTKSSVFISPAFAADWSTENGFPVFSRAGDDYFGNEISIDGGRVLIASALSGRAYILEAFDEFYCDTALAPAGVTEFLLRRSGDTLEVVNKNDPQQVIASRALNSTSSIRIAGRPTDKISIDAGLNFQLPYLQRAMPITISNVALTITGGAVGDTRVTMDGPDRMSIDLDISNPLASTIFYQGTAAVTNVSMPATLSILMPDSSDQIAIRDTGSTDDRLINLVDNGSSRTVLPYVFNLPSTLLSVNTGDGANVVDVGILPAAFAGRVDIQGGIGNDVLNAVIRPATRLNFEGGGGSNRLGVESTSPAVWEISERDSGFVEQVVFSGTGTISGGTQSDVFQFFTNGSLSGSINGSGGTNVIDYSRLPATATTPLFFSLNTARGSQFDGTFSQIQRVIGPDSAEATLTGRDLETTWIIDAANTGVLNDGSTLRFENFSKLEGGSDQDSFAIGVNGSMGRLFGGSGTDTLSYVAVTSPVDINISASAASRLSNGFSSIESFIGGSGQDQITGPNQSSTWTLGGSYGLLTAGTITNDASSATWSFDSFESFISPASSDTLIGTGSLATWLIEGLNTGNISSEISFAGFENLTGSPGANSFTIVESTGSLSGILDGGPGQSTLNYANWIGPITVDRQNGSAPGIGSFTRLTRVIGTSQRDRLIGKNQPGAWTLSSQNVGSISDGFAFTSFEELNAGTEAETLIGANDSQVWTINQANAGSVGTLNFTGFENLTGGTAGDQFNVLPSGSLSGKIDGGGGTDTLSYETWTSAIQIEQRLVGVGGNITGSIGSRATGLADGFAGIESIIGGTGTNDTLTGHNDFLINGVNSGIINPNEIYALPYSGFENLVGTSWETTGTLPGDFFYTAFRFIAGGFISGNLDGGDGPGSLDYSGYSGLVVEIDLASFTAPLIGGHWSNISGFTGSTNINRIRATNEDATWFFSDQSNLSRDVTQVIYSPLGHEFDTVRSFNGFNDLKAGNGNDTFYFETLFPKRMAAFPGYKYFYGSIDGGGGDNEVSLNQSQGSDTFGDITLNLLDGTFTPISGTIQNIGRYIRRSSLLEDTFRIIAPDQNNEWNIQSIDARNVYNSSTQQFETRYMATGSVNGIAFVRFDSLVGGAADDRFVLDSFVPFRINPGTGNNTLVLPDYDPAYGTVLFDYQLNRDNLIGFQTIEARSPTALSVGDFPTTWDIDGHNAGRVENSITPDGGLNFRGITAVLGAPTALDTVRFHDDGRIDGRLSANGTFQPGKDIVDYSAVTTPVTVSVALSFDNIGDTTGVGGQMNGFGIFIGGQSSDTFVADTLYHRWDILGIDRGVINSAANTGAIYDPFSEGPAQFRFDSFENLVGGFSNDEFRFAPLGDITGTIDRQSTAGGNYNTLFYGLSVASESPKPIGRTINLDRYRNVGRVTGSPGVDTLVGPDANNVWNLGRDSQSVSSNGWTTYWDPGDMENIQGGATSDLFFVSSETSLMPATSGGGGTDTLSFSEITANVSLDFRVGSMSSHNVYGGSIVIPFSNLERFIAPYNVENTVYGDDRDIRWNINWSNQWLYDDRIELTNFQNLTGGSQDDHVIVADTGSIDGILDGGDGSNTIDFSNWTLAQSTGQTLDINLAAEDGSAISSGLYFSSPITRMNRIQNVIGSPADDSITVYDDGVDHYIDGGPHQSGDTLQYISYGNGIVRTPGGNADHGTVRSGSGAVTSFVRIEHFETDGIQLTSIQETTSSRNAGVVPQGTASIEVLFSQSVIANPYEGDVQLFRLEDTDGDGVPEEISVPLLVERTSLDRINLSRVNDYGSIVDLGSGRYRLRIQGDGFTDAYGDSIDADQDGIAGGEYIEEFRVPTTTIQSSPAASSTLESAATSPILNGILFTYSGPVTGFVDYPPDGILLSVADENGDFQYVPSYIESVDGDPLSFRIVSTSWVGFVPAFATGLYRVQFGNEYTFDITGERVDGDGDGSPGGDFVGYYRFANSAPSQITLDNDVVREGRPAGSFIGFLDIQDPDPVDHQQSGFQIRTEYPFYAVLYGDRYALVTAQPLDFDQQSTYQTTVTVYDHAGAEFSKSFTIQVIPQDKLNLSETTISEESNESAEVIVRLNVQSSDAVRVYLKYDTTATIPYDLTAPHRSGTIRGIAYDDYIDVAPNASSGSLTLSAVDDIVYERFGESVTIRVVAADGLSSDSQLIGASAVLTIVDTDVAPEFDFRPVRNSPGDQASFTFTKYGSLNAAVGYTGPIQVPALQGNDNWYVRGEIVSQSGMNIATLGIDFSHIVVGGFLGTSVIPGSYLGDSRDNEHPTEIVNTQSYRTGGLLSGIPQSPNAGPLTFSIRYHLNPELGIQFKVYPQDVIEDGGLTIVRTYTISPADVTRPQSIVQSLPQNATSLSIPITVTGTDPTGPEGLASGVKEYDLYVATDSGPFTKFATVPVGSPSIIFQASSNRTYFFRSVARDFAGNEERDTTIGADAFIRVGDLDKPVTTSMAPVGQQTLSSPVKSFNLFGTDVGSGIMLFDIYVSIDGGPVTLAGSARSAVQPDNTYTAVFTYQSLRDGLQHTYRFFSRAKDAAGNLEELSAVPAYTYTDVFATPVPALTSTGIDVQQGSLQRSYIRNVDVSFSTTVGVAALVGSNRIKVEKFGLSATNVTPGTGTLVPFTSAVFGTGNTLRLDFGVEGLGGNRNTINGDGFYRILFDANNDGDYDDNGEAREFYRLLGDANGDAIVSDLDTAVVDRLFGRSGAWLDGDLNGDGVVTSTDKAFTLRTYRGRKLADAFRSWLDD